MFLTRPARDVHHHRADGAAGAGRAGSSRLARGRLARPPRRARCTPAPTDDGSSCRRRCRRRRAARTRSRSTVCWPSSRRRAWCAGRRGCRRGSTTARRATGSCSRKRRPSIAGSRVEVRGLVPGRDRGACARARKPHRPPRVDARFTRLNEQIRAFLAADPLAPPFTVDADGSPERVPRLGARADDGAATARRYRGVSLPWYWGDVVAAPDPLGPATPRSRRDAWRTIPRPRVAEMRRRPRVREAADDEDDDHAGTWVIRADEPQESVEDPFGLQRPADRDDDADPEGLGRFAVGPAGGAHGAHAGAGAGGAALRRTQSSAFQGRRRCRRRGAAWCIRSGIIGCAPTGHRARSCASRPAPLGDAAWVDAAKARHARLARRVRARFERLRPRLRQAGSAGGRFGARHRRMGRRLRRHARRRRRWMGVSMSSVARRVASWPSRCWPTSARPPTAGSRTPGGLSTSRRRRCSSCARRSTPSATAMASSRSPARAPTTCPCCR